ncbi:MULTISPECIES: hypothetical protein [Archaeoglobus]|jgi:hypothetical protein|uniref:Uncharacterized protein AF_2122 n=2 Tax=Archaeoglobus fulgidus TaxID=2234 RepID=Y2122_ARCFU|nr:MULTISPECIES: hypothetical protein [Archaeoglobus]O28158.1 RecName: Full=Uncharacterized protein AF_2122 [Archaeoglobus fulgidus DSM 4304]AAB89149.1 predicted coding region AF_2122 [Archaeoglobus fulgidus DSM 4304]AIG99109.1 hypothetical protein AFULGI_00023920 [Archaeoglobus fulgidus DSM 8774]MDI3498874.1 hypothetical protein [Archaeoglobus sp.]
MPIAAATDFALNAILRPISDIFVLIYGLLEPINAHLIPEHTNFIYGQLSLLLWGTKFLATILGVTANNATAMANFTDVLHTLSENSYHFFGTVEGESGMAYIAKHSYIELSQNQQLSEDMAVKFARAVNSTIIYFVKVFEYL